MEKSRRYELDWLRVLAILGVFFYHCGRFFNLEDWHVKNAEISRTAEMLIDFFDPWGMPLMLVIAGASTFFALQPGQAGRFMAGRTRRLLVPLAFGILVLSPPQVYLERLTHGEFAGSLLAFLPHYFDGLYMFGGNFAWMGLHLWFIEMLFLYTLILLPVFLLIISKHARPAWQTFAWISSFPGVLYLWILPAAACMMALDTEAFISADALDGLRIMLVYPIYLLYGYLLYADQQIQAAVLRQRWTSALLAGASFAAWKALEAAVEARFDGTLYVLAMISLSLLTWSMLLAFLGFGMRWLNRDHPLRSYANEGVLPFYVLHHPVILFLGYFVIQLPGSILAKYALIAVLGFVATWGLYEFGVRRVVWTRRMLGMGSSTPHLRPVAGAQAS